MSEVIIGRIEQLTVAKWVGDQLSNPRSVDMSPTPELMVQLYKALKMASCWCTEPVWYAPKMTPIHCSRCKAIDAYELRYGVPPILVEGKV
jgi:hypothetical protein